MRKLILIATAGLLLWSSAAPAQESGQARKERHKRYWKKVGADTRDFWKGEHEKKVKRDAERKQEPRKGPPKPPNPFKKKKKKEATPKEEA